MLKEAQNQLVFTHNKHGAMHLAVNAKVIEIVIL